MREFGKAVVKEEGLLRTTHVPNPPVAREATPLIVATRRGNVEIAAQLLQGGADVHAGHAEGFTALVYALKADEALLAKLLKDAGAKPPKYPEGALVAAWIAAAKIGDCTRLRNLIADGVDVNVKYASNQKEDQEEGEQESDGPVTSRLTSKANSYQ